MAETITKRLHVSGLTPQISEKDIKDRFSSFGTVRTLDGYGKRDGNGDPRRFVYLTLESTKGQLAKCLNLLSGTTWKGAKLRIGEAKVDFHERIAKEHETLKKLAEDDGSFRPRKRRRLQRGCQGIHASDMSLVTPENFSNRGGWHKTPLGRLIRPIRMRPLRPLPAPVDHIVSSKEDLKAKKARKRSAQLTRARRKLIDPTRWNSEYLKGILLENSTSSRLSGGSNGMNRVELDNEEDIPEAELSEGEDKDDDEPLSDHNPVADISTTVPHRPASDSPPNPSPSPTPNLSQPIESDVALEATKDLALLSSIFGNADSDGNDWGGEESLSDIDMSQAQTRTANVTEGDIGDIEFVPKEGAKRRNVNHTTDVDNESSKTVKNTTPDVSAPSEPQAVKTTVQTVKLKDMFAPREEDAAGFSLLGNLDIDLELDDTINIPAIIPSTSTTSVPQLQAQSIVAPISSSQSVPYARTQFTLDPIAPLFFPLVSNLSTPSDAPSRHPNANNRGRVKDVMDIAREKGWDRVFYRQDGEEEIRQRWEKAKVELTKEWKRRHREGVKSVRRRGGGD